MITLETYHLLVRIDFMLAVLLSVLAPLVLLAAAWRTPGLRARMLAYWRTSALLMITTYLLMGREPSGLYLGVLARVLIPVTLWRGDGLQGDLPWRQLPLAGRLVRGFRVWRSIMTAYCLVGVLWTSPLLTALWHGPGNYGRIWFEEVSVFRELFHPGAETEVLARMAYYALVAYGLYALASVVVQFHRPGKAT